MEKILSNWTGSTMTAELVKKQIIARWGIEEALNYDPKSNCLTFSQWQKSGYRVKRGEKAIKSFIVIERKDKENKVIGTYPKQINLFYVRQVQKIE
jgi:hypothetical protein